MPNVSQIPLNVLLGWRRSRVHNIALQAAAASKTPLSQSCCGLHMSSPLHHNTRSEAPPSSPSDKKPRRPFEHRRRVAKRVVLNDNVADDGATGNTAAGHHPLALDDSTVVGKNSSARVTDNPDSMETTNPLLQVATPSWSSPPHSRQAARQRVPDNNQQREEEGSAKMEFPDAPNMQDPTTTVEAVSSYLLTLRRGLTTSTTSGAEREVQRRALQLARNILVQELPRHLPSVSEVEQQQQGIHWTEQLAEEIIRLYAVSNLRFKPGCIAINAAEYLYRTHTTERSMDSKRDSNDNNRDNDEYHQVFLTRCISQAKLAIYIHQLLYRHITQFRFVSEYVIPQYVELSQSNDQYGSPATLLKTTSTTSQGDSTAVKANSSSQQLGAETTAAWRHAFMEHSLSSWQWMERYYVEKLLPSVMRDLQRLIGNADALLTPFSSREQEAFSFLLTTLHKALGQKIISRDDRLDEVAFNGVLSRALQPGGSVPGPRGSAPAVDLAIMKKGLHRFTTGLHDSHTRSIKEIQSRTSALDQKVKKSASRFRRNFTEQIQKEDCTKAVTSRAMNFNVEVLFPVLQFFSHPASLQLLSCLGGEKGAIVPVSDEEQLAEDMLYILLYTFQWTPVMRSYQVAAAASLYARLLTYCPKPNNSTYMEADNITGNMIHGSDSTSPVGFHTRALVRARDRARESRSTLAITQMHRTLDELPSPLHAISLFAHAGLKYADKFIASDMVLYLPSLATIYDYCASSAESALREKDGFQSMPIHIQTVEDNMNQVYVVFSRKLENLALHNMVSTKFLFQIPHLTEAGVNNTENAAAVESAEDDENDQLVSFTDTVSQDSAGPQQPAVIASPPRRQGSSYARIHLNLPLFVVNELAAKNSYGRARTTFSPQDIKVVVISLRTLRNREPLACAHRLSSFFFLQKSLYSSHQQPKREMHELWQLVMQEGRALSHVKAGCASVNILALKHLLAATLKKLDVRSYDRYWESDTHVRTLCEEAVMAMSQQSSPSRGVLAVEASAGMTEVSPLSIAVVSQTELHLMDVLAVLLETLLSYSDSSSTLHFIAFEYCAGIVEYYTRPNRLHVLVGGDGQPLDPFLNRILYVLFPLCAILTLSVSLMKIEDTRAQLQSVCTSLLGKALSRPAVIQSLSTFATGGQTQQVHALLQHIVNLSYALGGDGGGGGGASCNDYCITNVPQLVPCLNAMLHTQLELASMYTIVHVLSTVPKLDHFAPWALRTVQQRLQPWLSTRALEGRGHHVPLVLLPLVPYLVNSSEKEKGNRNEDVCSLLDGAETTLDMTAMDVFSDRSTALSADFILRVALESCRRVKSSSLGTLNSLIRLTVHVDPTVLSTRWNTTSCPSSLLRKHIQEYICVQGPALLQAGQQNKQHMSHDTWATADALLFLTLLVEEATNKGQRLAGEETQRKNKNNSHGSPGTVGVLERVWAKTFPQYPLRGTTPATTTMAVPQGEAIWPLTNEPIHLDDVNRLLSAALRLSRHPKVSRDAGGRQLASQVLRVIWPIIETSMCQFAYVRNHQGVEEAANYNQFSELIHLVSIVSPDRVASMVAMAFQKEQDNKKVHAFGNKTKRGTSTSPEINGALHALVIVDEVTRRASPLHESNADADIDATTEYDRYDGDGDADQQDKEQQQESSQSNFVLSSQALRKFQFMVITMISNANRFSMASTVDMLALSRVIDLESTKKNCIFSNVLFHLFTRIVLWELGNPSFFFKPLGEDSGRAISWCSDDDPNSFDAGATLSCVPHQNARPTTSGLPTRLKSVSAETWRFSLQTSVKHSLHYSYLNHLEVSERGKLVQHRKNVDDRIYFRMVKRHSSLWRLALLTDSMVVELRQCMGPISFVALATDVLHIWMDATPRPDQQIIVSMSNAFRDARCAMKKEDAAMCGSFAGLEWLKSTRFMCADGHASSALSVQWLQPWLALAWEVVEQVTSDLARVLEAEYKVAHRSQNTTRTGDDDDDEDAAHSGATMATTTASKVLDLNPIVAFLQILDRVQPHLREEALYRMVHMGESSTVVTSDASISYLPLLRSVVLAVQTASAAVTLDDGDRAASLSAVIHLDSLMDYCKSDEKQDAVHIDVGEHSPSSCLEGDLCHLLTYDAAAAKAMESAEASLQDAREVYLSDTVFEYTFPSTGCERILLSESHVRRRLMSLRPSDLTRLLLLLLQPKKTAAKDGNADLVAAATSGESELVLRASLILEAITDMLPSASGADVVAIVHALLPLWWHSSSNALHDASAEHKGLAHELRRLLANVPPLMANDVDRFFLHNIYETAYQLHDVQQYTCRETECTPGSTVTDTHHTNHMLLLAFKNRSLVSYEAARSLRLALVPESLIDHQAAWAREVAAIVQEAKDSDNTASGGEAPTVALKDTTTTIASLWDLFPKTLQSIPPHERYAITMKLFTFIEATTS